MGLNIKNERVHALAREAAARTGQTQTSVIETALERLLAELDKPDPEVMRAKVDAILAAVDAEMTDEMRAALLADDLYDENGLPA
ncbi:type II toxin-antitoxin system VapB family antitoxin [Lapillicoccus sp.]|jgi:antitoxin VapB|uniref:type II toxin-antitoxin system VapB family antitoxin n=1 Tax=Lapillicoccus sp. TaxID=1909287 RepID=UPI0025E4F71E|nr:type II toxin-antitoxin system VapB family antitoxin [Lapillicoccus sp.]